MTKAPPWHGLVAWDMFFNGLTTGLFLTAATSELMFPAIFAPLAQVAYPLALVLLLIDLGCLVGDLGDPLRFHHMLRVFKLGSPMSVGTWCLTIYSLPLTLVAVVSVLNWPVLASVRDFVPSGALAFLEWVRKPAVVSALLPAIGSAVYKGVLISTNSQPGWKRSPLAGWLPDECRSAPGNDRAVLSGSDLEAGTSGRNPTDLPDPVARAELRDSHPAGPRLEASARKQMARSRTTMDQPDVDRLRTDRAAGPLALCPQRNSRNGTRGVHSGGKPLHSLRDHPASPSSPRALSCAGRRIGTLVMRTHREPVRRQYARIR